MRRAFGLLQALLVIVMVSGIMTIAMKYATVTVKQTKDLYIKESAEMFLDSAVELAILAIQGYERNATNGCLHEVNITSVDKRFRADINISRYFLYENPWNCDRNQIIQTEDSHGFVMFDVRVESNESHPKNAGAKIVLYRRTLQRP